ncbi:S-layer homology domain-containing protein [Paenibacillus mendelii]|uniref:S-layer homology domain-containing protein n=1 Tax=Paenibacillus mendelii TaxID=206163 RepID=A0ABV6JMI3_9BACL|nr:S-layer homology domain-containing protein [Paenibacillus mendelii]
MNNTSVTLDGVYTLVVTDDAGNKTTVNFEIDKVAPTVTGVANNGNYKEAVNVTFNEGTAKLNGAAFASGTDIDQDGSYTLVVTDAAGNVTTVSFKIDTVAPTVSGVTAGGIYKAKVTPSFNEGTATLNGAAFTSGTDVVQDGIYTLVVTDAAGNVATVSFEIDKTAPNVTGVSNGGFYNSEVTVGFNEGTATLNGAAFAKDTEIDQDGAYTLVVTDAAGNVTTVSFMIDTVAPVVTGVADGGVYKISKTLDFNEGTATLNGAAFTSGTEVTQDGIYTLVVTDQAGNVTTVGFTIDTTAPVVTGVANNGIFKSKVTAEFNEGTATLNGNVFVSGMEIVLDGDYTLVVTDTAGNATTVNFKIDNVAPIVTGVTEGGIYKSVTPGFNEGTAKLNGTAYINGTEIDQDGAYTLVVTDAAGNATTIQFQIDATAPTGTVIIQAGAEWTNVADVTLTLTSNDGNNGSGIVEMRFSSNGSDWGSWEPSAVTRAWSLVTGDGEKAVYVQFKDKAGNESGTIHDVIKLDQTIPTGTIVINSGATTTNSKSVTVTLTSSDGAGSGVTEMRFSEDNLTWLNWENVLPAKNWSFTGSSGLKNLYVQFRDAAGNVSVANKASITYQESYGSYGGASGSTGSTDNASSPDVVISTGSKSEIAAKVDIKMVEGKQVTTVLLEEAQLNGMLNESGNKPVITITVHNNSDTVNLEMDAALLQSLENNNAIIQVYTESVIYTLPLAQVSVNKWRNQLGADIPLKDMKIKVEVSNLPTSTFVFKNSGDGQVTLVVPPVSFSIKGLHGNKEIELNQFDAFVERRFAIPAGIDPARITTGVKLMSDGTIIHIPTKVIREGGRDYAILNSRTNSIYGLIYNQKTFNDVSNHWAQESINDLASRLVINGADEKRFLPDGEITRAEFTAIIIRALGLSSANKTFHFKDVAEKAWYHQAVQIGYSYGLVDGHSDDSFKPNEKITRQEAMVILSRAMKLVELNKEIDNTKQQELVNHFADSQQLASWARQAAALTIEIGVIGGYKGKLRPLQNITRAETAAIIQRFLQKAEFI